MKLLREIAGWENDWPRPVSPEVQWKPGRSAMELARAFFRNGEPRLPDALRDVFRATPDLANLVLVEGIPELTTTLPPTHAAGPRHHDMWMRGTLGNKLVGVGVEAKVDEPFDDPISHKYRLALRDREGGKPTNKPERYQAVTSLVLRRPVTEPELKQCSLRYQLVSGVAGTLLQASREGRAVAVFVVYELITEASDADKRDLNQTDFDMFLEHVSARRDAATGLFGPLRYEAGPHLPNAVELWLGKVSERIEAAREEVSSLDDVPEGRAANDRDTFLCRCAEHLISVLDIRQDEVERSPSRIKAALPGRPSVFLRVEATNNRPRRVEVALKAGAGQVTKWPHPGEVEPPSGVRFEQWKDGAYTRSGFRWLRDAGGFHPSQQRSLECIEFLARWAKLLP